MLFALMLAFAAEGPPADSAEALPRLRIAVQEPEVDRVEPRIGRIFASALVRELRKVDRTTIVSMDEVRALIEQEADRQLAGCDESGCLAEIADALGADELVISRLSRVGDEHVLSVRRLDAKHPDAARSFERRFDAKDGEEFLAAVGPVVKELWKERPLARGERRGVDKEIARRLNPPPLSPPWFVTATVVAGAALAGGVGSGALALVLHEQNQRTLSDSVNREIDGRALVDSDGRAQAAARFAQVGFGLAGVAAVTSGVLFFFTDFEGVGRAAE